MKISNTELCIWFWLPRKIFMPEIKVLDILINGYHVVYVGVTKISYGKVKRVEDEILGNINI